MIEDLFYMLVIGLIWFLTTFWAYHQEKTDGYIEYIHSHYD